MNFWDKNKNELCKDIISTQNAFLTIKIKEEK
jgi:hypothetical protein